MKSEKKIHPNVQKSYDAMCDVDRFLVELQEKWDAKTLMVGLCWSLGKWIAHAEENKTFLILADCMHEIILSTERQRRYEKQRMEKQT